MLLHTEIMRDHLLVERVADGWTLTGLIDFEPAMLGAAEYDFASAGLFLAGGEAGLFRSFLSGYGLNEGELVPELQERVMAYALLHRYSDLRWYLETVPPVRANTLHELAREWWPLE